MPQICANWTPGLSKSPGMALRTEGEHEYSSSMQTNSEKKVNVILKLSFSAKNLAS